MALTLANYVLEMGKLNPTKSAFAAQVNCPVLVESAHGGEGDQPDRAFRTEFVADRGAMLRTRGSDQREVFLIQKRSGSAFAGHIGVGRTPNLDVVIARTGVSKFHAYFSINELGLQLTDKDSTNGTYINGTRLMPGVLSKVPDRAEVRFAHHNFVFMTPEEFYALVHQLAARSLSARR